ncbi:MAG: hypothetical protein EBU82_13025, partial [Flavobacteriia bacterium]|nr:hypothetical protein [Flavobacteriia bacterium]
MNITNQLPKNLEKTISDLARAREKAAKQKYLLDLSETLVMHLCSFVLGEYKEMGKVHIPLEKSFLQQKKNLGFGVYQGWLRESSKFLNQEKQPSEIHDLLHGSHDFLELSQFIKAYVALKSAVENNHENYMEQISQSLKNQPGKVNLLQFFDVLIEFRNRVAHPHKEVKGKVVTWPFSEEYFDAINPFLESGLNRVINELGKIWEFRQFVVDSNEQGVLTLISEDSNEPMEVTKTADYPEGIKVFAAKDTVLLSDWKLLLRAGEEAVEKIRQEEEELRNKATVEDLKESIKAALGDEQISLDELNFFESIGKTRMGLSKEQIKHLILEVAHKMGIEDPFPEVDKRFIEAIDHAITTKTYNEFLLKLTGQQYGVSSEQFEKLFIERTFALNADPVEVRRNKVIQMSANDFKAYANLMRAQQWIYALGTFSRELRGIYNMTAGAADTFASKEYWQRWSFNAVEDFAKKRIETISPEPEHWQVKMNMWQQGNMAGYAWCSIFPKESPVKSVLALDLAINNSERIKGDVMIGFLPNRKDEKLLENAGLLYALFALNLKEFTEKFMDDIRQYPHLKMWDSINFCGNYPLSEITEKYPWFYTYLYALDEIQFVLPMQELVENPSSVQETFDISFNLFNGLFDEVIRDYQNLKSSTYLIHEFETTISVKLKELFPIFDQFGLIEQQHKKEKLNDVNEATSEEAEVVEEVLNGLTGSVNHGHFSKTFRTKEQGFPLLISFSVRQDY